MNKLRQIVRALLTALLVNPCLAQSPTPDTIKMQADEELRNIVPERFVHKRRKKSTIGLRNRIKYKRIDPKGSNHTPPYQTGVVPSGRTAAPQYGQIGLTIWRLRRSVNTDTGPHLMVRETSGVTEWTPFRVEASTAFAIDDLVRLSIESSIEGYLYVIDRGQYRDGTISEPKLIFPTTRTRGGDNSVRPGRVIEIPAQDDRPSYFRLKSTRGELVSELLTIVITKKPIEELAGQIGLKPLALDEELVKKWERTWAGNVEHFELNGGKGAAWTKAEQEAGSDATRELTQDDAPPQTIYRVNRKSGSPILVNAELRVRPNANGNPIERD
jgi:hypothetical protein